MKAIGWLTEKLQACGPQKMRIPAQWNQLGFDGAEALGGGVIEVDAAGFYLHTLKALAGRRKKARPRQLSERVLYNMLLRAQSAWDVREEGNVRPGTFLRTLCLLPLLEKMGVNTLCLLPVTLCSRRYPKGSLPSPYACADFFALDTLGHDELLGACTQEALKMQCRALIEACHHLGMDVMMDFVFRTCGREHVWLREHPDWFYWIDRDRLDDFGPPAVPGYKPVTILDERNASAVYSAPGTEAYLEAFRFDPRGQDKKKWERVKGEPDLLAAIEEAYGITTAPAFSDCLNDIQPPWTDVTYLRYDLARSSAAEGLVPGDLPPFILFDSIKLDVVPPTEPNEPLWDLVRRVIPYYMDEFGIDGARLDMAHALPRELVALMIGDIRKKRPDFLLWSEELAPGGGEKAKAQGFDFISGSLWHHIVRTRKRDYLENLVWQMDESVLPTAASVETPDTPRFFSKVRDRALGRSLLLLAMLLPGGMAYVNGGMELGEVQPMNLGLGKRARGDAVLPAEDPMASVLAFFDPYRMHYADDDGSLQRFIARAVKLRMRLLPYLKAEHAVLREGAVHTLCYKRGAQMLQIVLNLSKDAVRHRVRESAAKELLYLNGQFSPQETGNGFELEPGGLVVLRVQMK
ncbi:MAG: alpha-amylase family glycosyl hydrolase [Christensenellales bacterium]|jgi:starch synthase (maltosyl-transferring)